MATTEGKKKQNREPTLKQKKAIAILGEKGGSISGAMRAAGYSPMTAKNPDKLTNTPAFKTFLDELEKAGVTDAKIAETISEGMNATKTIVMGGESNESFVDIQPDHQTRHKFVETAIKVKGHVRPVDPTGNTVNNFGQMIIGKGGKYED